MRHGCYGNCQQGRRPCTMPGTCGRVIQSPAGVPWWRDPDVRDALATGSAVALVALILLAAALLPYWWPR